MDLTNVNFEDLFNELARRANLKHCHEIDEKSKEFRETGGNPGSSVRETGDKMKERLIDPSLPPGSAVVIILTPYRDAEGRVDYKQQACCAGAPRLTLYGLENMATPIIHGMMCERRGVEDSAQADMDRRMGVNPDPKEN